MKRSITHLLTLVVSVASASAGYCQDLQPTKAETKQVTTKAKKNKEKTVRTVEMFQAMDEGLVTVEYIGKSSKEANIIFKNKTGDSLDVQLPATFGAVPVLAQMGGMGMGGMGMGGMGGMGGGMGGMGGMGGGMGGMGGGQGMGGGFGGGMGGMGGMGGGMGGMGGGGMGGMGMGGMMRVEPDKPKKVNVAMVCLEHGKDDPTPKMKYKIVRLNEVNPSPIVQQICLALANRQVDQKVAQAAAWHVANELSWPELLNKPRYITQFNGVELFFNPLEIQSAVRLVSYANAEAMKLEEENAQQYQSPGQTGETVSVGEQLANGDK